MAVEVELLEKSSSAIEQNEQKHPSIKLFYDYLCLDVVIFYSLL